MNLLYEWVSEWVSEWEWVSLRGRRERVWVSEWVCVWTFRFCNEPLKELCIGFISAYLESYKLDIYVAPPGNFVQLRLAQKHLTQISKTRVLIKSQVLETRDASFIHCFRTGQLTKLLKYYCYLERVSFVRSPSPCGTRYVGFIFYFYK